MFECKGLVELNDPFATATTNKENSEYQRQRNAQVGEKKNLQRKKYTEPGHIFLPQDIHETQMSFGYLKVDDLDGRQSDLSLRCS